MADDIVATLQLKYNGAETLAGDPGTTAVNLRAAQGVVSVSVDMRMDSPDMFSIEFDMKDLEKDRLLDTFELGAEITVSMQMAEACATPLCIGEISYIEPCFDAEAGHRTTISGYHKLHRLTRGQRSKTWGDGLEASQVPTTAVKDVINNSKAHEGAKTDGMAAGQLAPTDVKLKYIPQLNMSDFEFLRAIGANLEFKADPDGAKDVKFTKADPASAPVKVLAKEALRTGGAKATGDFILTATFRMSTVQQYAAVEVRGWDPETKKNIVSKVTSSTYAFDGSKGHEETGKGLYKSGATGRKYIVVDQPIGSAQEAKALAQALFDQFSMDFLTGEAVVTGDPKLRPGETVQFDGFGKAYSGKYLITSATHTFRPEEGYRTAIAFARNVKAA